MVVMSGLVPMKYGMCKFFASKDRQPLAGTGHGLVHDGEHEDGGEDDSAHP